MCIAMEEIDIFFDTEYYVWSYEEDVDSLRDLYIDMQYDTAIEILKTA